MRFLHWTALSAAIVSLMLSSCSGQTAKTTVSASTPATDQALPVQPSLTPTAAPFSKNPADEAFEAYMNDVIQGEDGLNHWCQSSQGIASQFYAPRAYRLLRKEINEPKKVATYVFQLDSSNKGGSQITANWVLFLEKKESSNWCVSYVGEKN